MENQDQGLGENVGPFDRHSELAAELEDVQKKTFTRWVNGYLKKISQEIVDLFKDFQDGTKLLLLLECLSGEQLPKPARGRLRVHRLENVGNALNFLRVNKVKLENISSENIVDGNTTLTLGLVWTIILRFQIQDIKLEGDAKSAKDALLYWCKKITKEYGLEVDNFTNSWKDGMAFNAIIHYYRPDLIDYESLKPHKPLSNLTNAFTVAEQQLGLPSLLDPQDVMRIPDERSIMTYLVSYYLYFSKLKSEEVDMKRLAKVVDFLLEIDKMQHEYERMSRALLEWIERTVKILGNREFPNTLAGMQALLTDFKTYRTVEKPPKFVEKGNLEAHLFAIQTKLLSHSRPMYHPPEGHLVSDINAAWKILERAEHLRETDLRDELINQQRLQQLAAKFNRKAALREEWLLDNEKILKVDDFGPNLASVEASLKRHEAIDTDVKAHDERVHAVLSLGEELISNNYHASVDVQDREEAILASWRSLLELLKARRSRLDDAYKLEKILKDLSDLSDTLQEAIKMVSSDAYGLDLTAAEDLLHKLNLHEVTTGVYLDQVYQVNALAQVFVDQAHPRAEEIKQRQKGLHNQHELLVTRIGARKVLLEGAIQLYMFQNEADEIELWIRGKEPSAASIDFGKDLTGVWNMQKKHQSLMTEIQAYEKSNVVPTLQTGLKLIAQKHFASSQIEARSKALSALFGNLRGHATERKNRLEQAQNAHQFYTDANESESWMRERETQASIDDNGKDEASTDSYIKKVNELLGEVKAYKSAVLGLREQSNSVQHAYQAHEPSNNVHPEGDATTTSSSPANSTTTPTTPAPVPAPAPVVPARKQLKAAHTYKGTRKTELSFTKGDIFTLIEQTTPEWWSVETSDGKVGFVPASYVKEVKQKTQPAVPVPDPATTSNSNPAQPSSNNPSSTSIKAPDSNGVANTGPKESSPEAIAVQKRMKDIEAQYAKLVNSCNQRLARLLDVKSLYALFREAEDIESWIHEKHSFAESGELGRDLEYAVALTEKFEDFTKDLNSRKVKVNVVNDLAQKFLAEGHSQANEIKVKLGDMNDKWTDLLHQANEREENLRKSKEVQTFLRDIDETKSWIQEKSTIVMSDDYGRDLASVNNLLRNHEAFERDLQALSTKMEALLEESSALSASYPSFKPQLTQRRSDLLEHWEALKVKAQTRKLKLLDSVSLQKFRSEARELSNWIKEIHGQISSKELTTNLQSAEALKERHQDFKIEIDSSQDTLDQIGAFGRDLCKKGHYASDELQDKIGNLAAEHHLLTAAWKARDNQLDHCLEGLRFYRDCAQIEGWISTQEGFLDNKDLGDSIDAVQTLLKLHETYAKALLAQEVQMQALNGFFDKLINYGHYDLHAIDERHQAILVRRAKLHDSVQKRQADLEASLELQLFLRDVAETEAWIGEQIQTANDPSYDDTSNLQGKIQSHQTFTREVQASKGRLASVTEKGHLLNAGHHYAHEVITENMKRLTASWDTLLQQCQVKSQRLNQANQLLEFNRLVEDIDSSCAELKALLSHDESGKDLASVKTLMKKQELLESELSSLEDRIESLRAQALEFIYAGHYHADTIRVTQDAISAKYKELVLPCQNRRRRVEKAHALHQLLHDIGTEQSWLKEKESLASSTELGKDLPSVQNMQRRHQLLESEVVSHEAKLNTLNDVFKDLEDSINRRGSFGDSPVKSSAGSSNSSPTKSNDSRISQGSDELSVASTQTLSLLGSAKGDLVGLATQFENLQALLVQRRSDLDRAEVCQQFYVDCNAMEAALAERIGLANIPDTGKTLDATHSLLKKHNALVADNESIIHAVLELKERAEDLLGEEHHDSENIQTRLAAIEVLQNSLVQVSDNRAKRLEYSLKVHELNRDLDEAFAWIAEKEPLSSSKDVGIDFEECEILQKKHEGFTDSLGSGEKEVITPLLKAIVELEKTKDLAPSETFELLQDRVKSLQSSWSDVQDAASTRTDLLAAALEIHDCNRSVDEILARVNEKAGVLVVDDEAYVGKDLATISAMQRKHDGFERDLAALELQITKISQATTELAERHPNFKEHLAQKHSSVSSEWSSLLEKTSEIKGKLSENFEVQLFLKDAEHYVNWMNTVNSNIAFESAPKSVEAAEAQLLRHQGLKTDVDARSKDEKNLFLAGEELLSLVKNETVRRELQGRLDEVSNTKEALTTALVDTHQNLEQAVEYQVFVKEVDHVNDLFSRQEGLIASNSKDLGTSVDSVLTLLQQCDEVEKFVLGQGEQLGNITQSSESLVSKGHADSGSIKTLEKSVFERKERVLASLQARRGQLLSAQRYFQFLQDVDEINVWISQKLKIAMDESYKDPMNLQSKLTKHEVFESELRAHKELIDAKDKEGQDLIAEKHFASANIRTKLKELQSNWQALMNASDSKRKKLIEALKFVQFNLETDEVEAWLKEKIAMATSDDLGRDLEHVMILLKKFEEFKKELAVDEAKISNVSTHADRLVDERHPESLNLRKRKKELNGLWAELKVKVNERQKNLDISLEINRYYREVDETKLRIAEKEAVVTSDDFGKDVASVEVLQRKHEILERDMGPLDDKMAELTKESRNLTRQYRQHEKDIKAVQAGIETRWDAVRQAAQVRKSKLQDMHDMHTFFIKHRDLMSWIKDIKHVIGSDELATSVRGAEILIKRHMEHRSEIDARQGNFAEVVRFGQKMISKGHFASSEIQEKLDLLASERETLSKLWEDRKSLFDQCQELQLYLRDVEQIEEWIGVQLISLSIEELGDSIDATEVLIKKHEEFEKTIVAQEEKIQGLRMSSATMTANNHYASELIESRREAVLSKHSELLREAENRSMKLADSYQLQLFLRDALECQEWIRERMLIAGDESFKDSSNLQRKVQRHQAFEAELAVNRERVDSLQVVSEKLTSNGHYASADIEAIIDMIEKDWVTLQEESALKGLRLKEAFAEQQFSRRVEDMESWCQEIEDALASEDVGRDLTSVRNLLKKLQLLEADIVAHKERVDTLTSQAQEMCDGGNFKGDIIHEKEQSLVARYKALDEPLAARRVRLDASLVAQQFFKEILGEKSWVKEREPLILREDVGQDLISVQNLLKLHLSLESDFSLHESRITALESRAAELTKERHFASPQIIEAKDEFIALWNEMKSKIALRHEHLDGSLKAQEFYTHASESESWMKERLPLVSSDEYGADEDQAMASSKKHDAVKGDIDVYQKIITGLANESQGLIAAGNQASASILARQQVIQDQYDQIVNLAIDRQGKLMESVQFHQFNRDVDEIVAWLAEVEGQVSHTEIGKDLEDAEILIKKHDDATKAIALGKSRYESLITQGTSLVCNFHSQSDYFQNRIDQITARWDKLQDRTRDRSNELADGREYLQFVRDLDETRGWMKEKESVISDDYGKDVPTVEDLTRKHVVFERDLAALEEKVKFISAEASRIVSSGSMHSANIQTKCQEIEERWKTLFEQTKFRTKKLADAHDLQLFLQNCRNLQSWMNDMINVISTEELAKDVPACETQQVRHFERKAEMDARVGNFNDLESFGKRLLAHSHYASETIESQLKDILSDRATMLRLWETKRVDIEHCIDMLMFLRDAAQASAWIGFRDSNLNEEELGTSLDEVEALLKQHDDYEKSLAAQEEKFKALQKKTKFELELERKEEEERRRVIEEEDRKRREAEEKARLAEEERQSIEAARLAKEAEAAALREAERVRAHQELVRREEELRIKREEEERKRKEDQLRLEADLAAKQAEIERLRKAEEHRKQQEEQTRIELEAARKREAQEREQHQLLLQQQQQQQQAQQKQHEQAVRANSPTLKHKIMPKNEVLIGGHAYDSLPDAVFEGQLSKKFDLDAGGVKSSSRSWKSLYAVIKGRYLIFFLSKESYQRGEVVAWYDLGLCNVGEEQGYHKRFVFRTSCDDGSSFLLQAHDQEQTDTWLMHLYDATPPKNVASSNNWFDGSSGPNNTASDSQSSGSFSVPKDKDKAKKSLFGFGGKKK